MRDARQIWTPELEEARDLHQDLEILRFALRYAILAPSGHNTQPWLFRIRADALELLADRTRALPVVDPEDRELVISCGCALLNARIALRALGRAPVVELLPDSGNEDLLARLRLGDPIEPDASDHALCEAIPRRRTNRAEFEDRSPGPELVQRLRAAAVTEGAWLVELDGARKEQAAHLVAEGDRIQMADPSFRRELAAWIHSNRSRSRDGIPGAAFGVGDLASILGPLVMRTFDMGEGQAAKDRELALGSPMLVILGTERDDQESWLRAGQALQRMLLVATSEGLDASYLNQPIEVGELRAKVAALSGRDGYPQLLIRMGHGPRRDPTPRREVAEVLV